MITSSDPIDVVIAEDSPIQALVLQRHLVKEGYTVRIGRDGAEALQQIRERRPTILISDIEMPEMNGYELCSAVKSDAELRSLPVMLLSSLSDPEDIIRGLEAGADNYVTKPYETGYLLSRMQSLLETPIEADEPQAESLQVTLAGKTFTVNSGRQQSLNLLVSTFENAVEKNRELLQTNEQLTVAQNQLEVRNRELNSLNTKLNDHNTRMTRDLEAGARVQQALLPSELPQPSGFRFAWQYRPCDELAGDFLNVFELDDDYIGFYVVDVSGHGVAASLLAVTVSRVLTPSPFLSSLIATTDERTGRVIITPPADVLADLNRRFPMEESADQYFTMAYGVLNTSTGEVRYASAGQPPILLMRHSADIELLKVRAFAIGWVADVDYAEHTLKLNPGDRLAIYSDGIPEAMSPEMEQLGDDRMLKAFRDSRDQELEQSVLSVVADVEAWCGKRGPLDDVSLLALEAMHSPE